MSEATKPVRLSAFQREVLVFLNGCGGGFTSAAIARSCGRARDRIQMAGFKSANIMPLYKAGLVDLIDRERPMVFVITNEGRAILKDTTP